MLSISGIEVIRGYHGALPASGNPGPAIEAVPPEKLELTYGDSLRITTGFGYHGLAGKATLYGAIGKRGLTFDEILKGEAEIDLPSSPTEFTPCSRAVDINITSDIKPGTAYDIYCKIKEYPEAGYPEVDDVIDIVGVPPTMKLIEETIYPYAYVYDGPCDVSTFTFTTIPFTPASWIAGSLAAHVEDEVKKAGGRVMEIRVYADENLLRPWTNWQIEVVGTSPTTTAGLGMSLGMTWWAVAILAALAILLIIVITWSITTIISSFTHKALSPEIKAPWSRETLISVIGDFETKLIKEGKMTTPTPPEELEKKSDDELREYCDALAEIIAPPGMNWLPWVIGGIGVLAVGGIAMAAMKKHK